MTKTRVMERMILGCDILRTDHRHNAVAVNARRKEEGIMLTEPWWIIEWCAYLDTDSFEDAGGTRAISQLKILGDMMHRLNHDLAEEDKVRPCDVFDMMGGVGSGGSVNIP